jgi:hypothetical protein
MQLRLVNYPEKIGTINKGVILSPRFLRAFGSHLFSLFPLPLDKRRARGIRFFLILSNPSRFFLTSLIRHVYPDTLLYRAYTDCNP